MDESVDALAEFGRRAAAEPLAEGDTPKDLQGAPLDPDPDRPMNDTVDDEPFPKEEK